MARKAKLNPALSTLYNAPDVRENRRLRGGISDVSPDLIDVAGRMEDRLQIDVTDLTASIRQNGQRVPILLRPADGDRFTLVYGRRRLEACRQLGINVRAIVTELEDDQALKDQLLENQARRDLSFIERALVAAALVEEDHLPEGQRSNKAVAEVLNLTEAGVSQMLGVVRGVGDDLIHAIGAAPGIGRPRWEELKRALPTQGRRGPIIRAALHARDRSDGPPDAASESAFLAALAVALESDPTTPSAPKPAGTQIAGVGSASVKTSGRGKRLRLDLEAQDKDFVSWLDSNAPALIAELHERWKRSED
ncbi:plasmid partitioning protein RepB [Chachezhania antarctica]|uniref:plasmid partitioning protein RepB n=1 Tax=Chachezhania antarctica TaxID=2340860 RepID=UPI000EAF15E6|nr:plasmid partitioning protein RepB [Chachezhania antarctica]|tara:strand:- start:4670 stop:5593 length:924 start_codon:yes stop_codon:yes gene_type:complete